MKRLVLGAGMLLLAALPAAAALDVDGVLKLHRAGIEAETLVAVVEASGTVFHLETEEILALKKAGVPESVIRAMVRTALRPGEDRPVRVREEGGRVILTNRDTEDLSPRPSPGLNVVPSRTVRGEEADAPRRTPLPPEASATVQGRGSFGIGIRWDPSWDESHRTGYPLGAWVDAGYGSSAGYYFLPASFGPDGPSHFGQFGFHLSPAHVPVRARPGPVIFPSRRRGPRP